VVTGNVQVDPRYLGTPNDLAVHSSDLSDPDALRRWKTWAEACQASGTPTIVQLNHVGRQAHPLAGEKSFFTKSLAPSAVPLDVQGSWFDKLAFRLFLGRPREMTVAEIDTVVDQFTEAAKMAFIAGFKGVELHAAHGYLLTQFLSPKINRRTDDYGGTPEKRLKLMLRIIHAVREATSKEFCIGVKLNSADFQVMGLDDNEVLGQVKAISEAGVDFIEISGGTYEKPLVRFIDQTPPKKDRILTMERWPQAVKVKSNQSVSPHGSVRHTSPTLPRKLAKLLAKRFISCYRVDSVPAWV
jgi:2,4-dienoyl-CoA reductase-like NADH-dependent reductase (Old Yellow Enzyme family)